MAETYYLSDDAGIACGPGTRYALNLVAGDLGVATIDLDATGDTWNVRPSPIVYMSYAAATWTVELYLKRAGFIAGSVRVTLTRMDGLCAPMEQILQKTVAVTVSTFTKHTFSAAAGKVIFRPDDLLLCVVEELAGDTSLEFDQPTGGNLSILITPTPESISPWNVYANSS